MIERYLFNGIYNIGDYNKKFKDKLDYIYVCLDEFAFFNPNSADTRGEKSFKKIILGLIKNIVLTGRSTGIFILTSLQKPTNSSIQSDIRSQLCTRIAFKLQDTPASVVILGNDHATKNKEREAICRTLGETIFKVPYINHKLIMKNIEDSILPERKYINAPYENEKTDGVINLEYVDY